VGFGQRVQVDTLSTAPITMRTKKKPAEAGLDVVEVRRLELLTPYMRSKCSTN
jgi:maleate cis-trans isomerase